MEKKKEKEKNKELEEREEEIVDWEQRLASQWSNVYIKRRELRGRERELLQREIAVSQRNEASIRLSAESRRVCEEATRAMKTISEWEEALEERDTLLRLEQRRQTSIRRDVQQNRG
ncbi:hypothetical protein A7D00_4208 [Trichophyton violaceum]|uniref:Uncharacterized protein n=1 Tax=Trichophyton violaceum TaxID=34388 RepID=A0A178FGN2_TRIVO|nr:hypothetical protein A7D00_4208 [Trichophyton violaceum]